MAALIYQRNKHTINLFVWPDTRDTRDTPMRSAALNGYNIVHWSTAGMTHWAVSDLNETELKELATLLRGDAPSASTPR